jgi:hypothetical protein
LPTRLSAFRADGLADVTIDGGGSEVKLLPEWELVRTGKSAAFPPSFETLMRYDPSYFLGIFYAEMLGQNVISEENKTYEMHMLMDQAFHDWATMSGNTVFYQAADEDHRDDIEVIDYQRMLDAYPELNSTAHIVNGFYDVNHFRMTLGLPSVVCLYDRHMIGQLK